ncbi:MAG: L-aspartate oxidase [Clostridium sp.]
MNRNIYDVIIIGSGISGLFTGLSIDRDKNILIVTKNKIVSGSSPLAQGGIVSQINKRIHEKDTIRAGAGHNCLKALSRIAEYSSECIEDLINLGVDFDRDEYGNLLYTLEGGHSINTILHCKDYTGLAIMNVLEKHIKCRDNVNILEDTMAIDIIDHNDFKEVVVMNDSFSSYYAKSIVIATGGIGRVYNSTTNPDEITGDGIAMAERCNIVTEDMEFIQFHPTALYSEGNSRKKLVSEALRGEGAILKGIREENFMDSKHPLKSLAPRDIVSRAIFKEMDHYKINYVYLDITSKSEDYLKKRFPSIYDECMKEGINISKDYIKVAPAQHYIMGGIKVDINGLTNIPNIYACGECARTGIHGANRLASNSLLEAIVFGKIIAKNISNKDSVDYDVLSFEEAISCEHIIDDNINFNDIKHRIGKLMDKNVSIIRSSISLQIAKNEIEEVLSLLSKINSKNREYFEVLNMATVARNIINSSINRRESLGAFYRID